MQECCCGVHAFVCSACAFSLFSLTEVSGVQLCKLHELQHPQRVKGLRRVRICSSCLLWSFGRNSQRISRAGYHSKCLPILNYLGLNNRFQNDPFFLGIPQNNLNNNKTFPFHLVIQIRIPPPPKKKKSRLFGFRPFPLRPWHKILHFAVF